MSIPCRSARSSKPSIARTAKLLFRAFVVITVLLLTACGGSGGGGAGGQSANEPGTFQFSAATYNGAENSASVNISVTRSNGSTGTATVDYSTSDGTATAGNDYTNVSGTLTFADGVTSQSFSIPILDDTTVEGDETVNLTLSNATGGTTLGTQSNAVMTITEDDSEVLISWSANRESSVNSPGGGYRVYYSTTPGFDISTANFVDVPYVSGPAAPTSTILIASSGTDYIKIVAYSTLNGTGSEPSQEISVVIP
jgi:major membrane immunogen (membrane-anchored lipoprotein)